jgi:hypothetical protein
LKKVLVLVEGQSEEGFVKELLQPHLRLRDLWMVPTMLRTSGARQPLRKGGVSNWDKMRSDLHRLCGDTSATAVTTMLDYYAMPRDVPGMASRVSEHTKRSQVAHVQAEIEKDLVVPRFRAYLCLHELESLLFADIDRWASRFDVSEIRELKANIGRQAPEDINESFNTAPSKRLERFLSGYRKTFHGPDCARDIGLETLRARCPHFGEWLTWLEGLGDLTPSS